VTVKARLARALLALTEYLGEDAGEGRILIRHKISQSDLAAMAGVARENVSRVLSDWKRRNLVTRSSGYYCLNDLTTFKRYLLPIGYAMPRFYESTAAQRDIRAGTANGT
jgi:CRP/FNR family transcriptional regulator, cyclic AMP receptor protein